MDRVLGLTVVLSAGLAQAQSPFVCAFASACGGSSTVFQGSTASSNGTNASSNASKASSDGSTNASTGSGQSSGQSTRAVPGPSSFVLVGSAALLAVGGGIITTVYVVKSQGDAKRRAEEFRKLHPPQTSLPAPTLDAMVLARAWLLANELQLKQDLALGAGPAIDDLAGIARIPPEHLAHFGRVLQRHRAQFVTSREMTPQQAAQVMSRVGDLVMADPIIKGDGEAALASL